jgi:preprotein translocase subunit SecE
VEDFIVARIETRRTEEDEEDFIEDVADDEEEEITAPVSSAAKRGKTAEKNTAALSTGKARPTPTQRDDDDKVKTGNVVTRFVQGISEYIRETIGELRKVTWLTREDVIRLTQIVLIVTAVAAAFLGFVGFLFGLLTQTIADGTNTVLAGSITIGLVIVVAGLWLFRDRLMPNRFE